MKNIYFKLILFLIGCACGNSQINTPFKISDSHEESHQYTFERTTNDEIINSTFTDDKDTAPTFKKKCGKHTLNSKRERCFQRNFYNILKNKFRTPKGYPNETIIILVIKFRINKQGVIERIEFLASNDNLGKVEKEVQRVLNGFPEIEPAIIDGKNVTIPYTFPISVKVN